MYISIAVLVSREIEEREAKEFGLEPGSVRGTGLVERVKTPNRHYSIS